MVSAYQRLAEHMSWRDYAAEIRHVLLTMSYDVPVNVLDLTWIRTGEHGWRPHGDVAPPGLIVGLNRAVALTLALSTLPGADMAIALRNLASEVAAFAAARTIDALLTKL